jgi:hypothetical protein
MPFELENPVSKQKVSFIIKSYFVNRMARSLNANIEWLYNDETTQSETFTLADEDTTAFTDFYANFNSDQILYDYISNFYNLQGTTNLEAELQ